MEPFEAYHRWIVAYEHMTDQDVVRHKHCSLYRALAALGVNMSTLTDPSTLALFVSVSPEPPLDPGSPLSSSVVRSQLLVPEPAHFLPETWQRANTEWTRSMTAEQRGRLFSFTCWVSGGLCWTGNRTRVAPFSAAGTKHLQGEATGSCSRKLKETELLLMNTFIICCNTIQCQTYTA